MPNLLQTGSDWLADQIKAHVSRLVSYERGAAAVAVAAGIGRTTFELETDDNMMEKWESRDFFIHAADLVLGGAATLPQRGDRIIETQGPSVYTYEVAAPEQEPVWRYSDSYRKLLRVHTTLV